jgi:hypothetical protein
MAHQVQDDIKEYLDFQKILQRKIQSGAMFILPTINRKQLMGFVSCYAQRIEQKKLRSC